MLLVFTVIKRKCLKVETCCSNNVWCFRWKLCSVMAVWFVIIICRTVKPSLPINRKALRAPGSWSPQDFQTVDSWRWQGCQPYTPAAFNPEEDSVVLISVRSWGDQKTKGKTLKNFKDLIGNRARDLAACCAVPQPFAPPHSSSFY